MNSQKEEIVKFFLNHTLEESTSTEGTSSSTASAITILASFSPPVKDVINMALDTNHITRRPAHIHCNLKSEDLQVLKELRVNFNNVAQNKMELRAEMVAQGWENYFARLHGPTYDLLI